MTEARTLSVSIRRPPAAIYDYLADPASFPRWSVFITAIRPEGSDWIATTPHGDVRIAFSPRNPFGVLDHHVTVNPQVRVYIPMRVVKNGEDGSEVLFTVFRQSGMSDQEYADDLQLVMTDLARLKRVLEQGKPG